MGWFSSAIAVSAALAFTASAIPHTFHARDVPAYKNMTYPDQKGRDYDYTGYEQNQSRRAEAVIEMFRFAWKGYYTYAFPNDDLKPVNNSFGNSRNGWGATAVDALDTAIIMEQIDIVNQILDFVPTIDFTKTGNGVKKGASLSVSLFETNIRYIGGMLSSYDLLKGPFKHLGVEEKKVDKLLEQCVVLADVLKFAFDTPSGIPVNNVFIHNQTFAPRYRMEDGTWTAGLAELGTLVLEWQHLSDLTGDPEYGKLARKAENYFLQPNAEVWPGLTGSNFSTKTGDILDAYGGWTSGNDSAYEVCHFFSSPLLYTLTLAVLDKDVRVRPRKIRTLRIPLHRRRGLHNRASPLVSLLAPRPHRRVLLRQPCSPKLLRTTSLLHRLHLHPR
jgi:mannosyl-oligosaccharide alpha-1,2-mannosidase